MSWVKSIFNDKVHLLQWCHTMDLLAIVTEKNELSIYRLSYGVAIQKIWSYVKTEKNKGHIKALCWRQDGKVIAITYEQSCLQIINAENGELLYNVENEDRLGCVHSLQWIDYQESKNEVNPFLPNEILKYMPKLPSFSEEERDKFNVQRQIQQLIGTTFNILMAMDNRMRIHF